MVYIWCAALFLSSCPDTRLPLCCLARWRWWSRGQQHTPAPDEAARTRTIRYLQPAAQQHDARQCTHAGCKRCEAARARRRREVRACRLQHQCSEGGKRLRRCITCRTARYCGEAHQLEDFQRAQAGVLCAARPPSRLERRCRLKEVGPRPSYFVSEQTATLPQHLLCCYSMRAAACRRSQQAAARRACVDPCAARVRPQRRRPRRSCCTTARLRGHRAAIARVGSGCHHGWLAVRRSPASTGRRTCAACGTHWPRLRNAPGWQLHCSLTLCNCMT
jgi:hypothetical protein